MSRLLVLGLVVCTSALTGLLLNCYIVLVLVYNRQVHTANNLLLLHLAVVDIASCIELLAATGPSMVATAVDSEGDTAAATTTPPCVLNGFVWTALLPIVIWTLCGLNCDRYAAIASPLHYSRLVRSKRIIVFLVVTWVVGVLLALPPLFNVNRYTCRVDRNVCLADFTDTASGHWYALTYACLAIVLPTFLIVFCNVRILSIARHHRHRIVSAIYEVTVRAQATITHQRNPFYLSKYKGRSAVITIVQLLGSLVVLYGPHCGTILWEMCTGQRSTPTWTAIAFGLVACAAPLNGFVYGVKSPVLRKAFKNFLRRQLYTSEVRQEIHQRRGSLSGRVWSSALLRVPTTPLVPCNHHQQQQPAPPSACTIKSEFYLPSTQLAATFSDQTFQAGPTTPSPTTTTIQSSVTQQQGTNGPCISDIMLLLFTLQDSTPVPITDSTSRLSQTSPTPLEALGHGLPTTEQSERNSVPCCPEDDVTARTAPQLTKDLTSSEDLGGKTEAKNGSPDTDRHCGSPPMALNGKARNGHCVVDKTPPPQRDRWCIRRSASLSVRCGRPALTAFHDCNRFVNFDFQRLHKGGSFVKRGLHRVFSPPPKTLCERGSI